MERRTFFESVIGALLSVYLALWPKTAKAIDCPVAQAFKDAVDPDNLLESFKVKRTASLNAEMVTVHEVRVEGRAHAPLNRVQSGDMWARAFAHLQPEGTVVADLSWHENFQDRKAVLWMWRFKAV